MGSKKTKKPKQHTTRFLFGTLTGYQIHHVIHALIHYFLRTFMRKQSAEILSAKF